MASKDGKRPTDEQVEPDGPLQKRARVDVQESSNLEELPVEVIRHIMMHVTSWTAFDAFRRSSSLLHSVPSQRDIWARKYAPVTPFDITLTDEPVEAYMVLTRRWRFLVRGFNAGGLVNLARAGRLEPFKWLDQRLPFLLACLVSSIETWGLQPAGASLPGAPTPADRARSSCRPPVGTATVKARVGKRTLTQLARHANIDAFYDAFARETHGAFTHADTLMDRLIGLCDKLVRNAMHPNIPGAAAAATDFCQTAPIGQAGPRQAIAPDVLMLARRYGVPVETVESDLLLYQAMRRHLAASYRPPNNAASTPACEMLNLLHIPFSGQEYHVCAFIARLEAVKAAASAGHVAIMAHLFCAHPNIAPTMVRMALVAGVSNNRPRTVHAIHRMLTPPEHNGSNAQRAQQQQLHNSDHVPDAKQHADHCTAPAAQGPAIRHQHQHGQGQEPLHKHAFCLPGQMANIALKHGSTRVLDYLADAQCPGALAVGAGTLDQVVRSGRVENIEWFVRRYAANGSMTCDLRDAFKACRRRSKQFCVPRGDGNSGAGNATTPRATDAASVWQLAQSTYAFLLENGRVDVVEYLHRMGIKRCTIDMLKMAATSSNANSLRLIQWATTCACPPPRPPTASSHLAAPTHIADTAVGVVGEAAAVATDHPRVSLSGGASDGAPEEPPVPEWRDAQLAIHASAAGRVHVLQWLHEVHRGSVTIEAARVAARNCHASVCIYLHQAGVAPFHRYNVMSHVAKCRWNAIPTEQIVSTIRALAAAGAPYHPSLMRTVIANKKADVAKAVVDAYGCQIDSEQAMYWAVQANSNVIIRWVRDNVPNARLCVGIAIMRALGRDQRRIALLGHCRCASCA